MAETIRTLSDKEVYPTDELIFSIIGNKRSVWEKIMSFLRENYPAGSGEWRYYNDGKQWLFKFLLKKKTVFWLSLIDDTFRITFYFGGKAESLISGSTLSGSIRKEFLEKEHTGPFRPVTIRVTGVSDLDDIYKLVELKIKHK